MIGFFVGLVVGGLLVAFVLGLARAGATKGPSPAEDRRVVSMTACGVTDADTLDALARFGRQAMRGPDAAHGQCPVCGTIHVCWKPQAPEDRASEAAAVSEL